MLGVKELPDHRLMPVGPPEPKLRDSFAPDRTTLSVMLPAFSTTSLNGELVRGRETAYLMPGGKRADGSGVARISASHAADANMNAVARLMAERGRLVRQDLEDELQVSKATANNILRELVEAGAIVRKGAGPSTYYALPQ